MSGHIATAQVEISAAPAQVWQALTDPGLIEQYMFGSKVESTWEPGTPITWSGEYNGNAYQDKGEVIAVEPEKRLEVTHFSPMSGAPDVPESYHHVTYELTDRGDEVQLTLRQDNNASEDEATHSSENWQQMLDGLKELVERG